jgi:hypothetical protein
MRVSPAEIGSPMLCEGVLQRALAQRKSELLKSTRREYAPLCGCVQIVVSAPIGAFGRGAQRRSFATDHLRQLGPGPRNAAFHGAERAARYFGRGYVRVALNGDKRQRLAMWGTHVRQSLPHLARMHARCRAMMAAYVAITPTNNTGPSPVVSMPALLSALCRRMER